MYQQMALSSKLGVVEISTLWHFRIPSLLQIFIKVASSPRLSGIGMPSPILWSQLLKMLIALLSLLLWWELGTNCQVLVSDCRYGVSPVNYLDPDPVLDRAKQGNYHTHVLYTIPNPNYTLPKFHPFIITYPIHHATLGTQTGRVLP